MDFNILTLNVAGLSNIIRNRLKKMVRQLPVDVLCLQETHLKKEVRYLRQIFWGHIYHTTGKSTF